MYEPGNRLSHLGTLSKRDRTEECTGCQSRSRAHTAPRLENIQYLVYELPTDSVWCTNQFPTGGAITEQVTAAYGSKIIILLRFPLLSQ